MFETIRHFFKTVSRADNPIHFDENDHRLAAAALLTHAMLADGTVRAAEQNALKSTLKRHYALKPDELDELIREGAEADNNSVDFYAFTSVLKRSLDHPGREAIVEMLWEIVLVDGVVHELEDNVVWRVAELLGVETRERVLLRQRVEARLAEHG
ncbi:MAG: TerB family tellurite resistance protein [Rhizobiales bacterium]|nr:TerB family tellurite resistance protein [Hyphomicrobiales bacterium]